MYLLLLVPLLCRLSGSVPIWCPEEVRGKEQESLVMQCRYEPGWKTHVKWWCRGAAWSSCNMLARSIEPKEKSRISIRDNKTSCVVTVTMEELRLEDTDIYWCGIERYGTDHGAQVSVIIDPVLTTTTVLTTPTTSTATSTNVFTVEVAPENNAGNQTVTSHQPPEGSRDPRKLSILLPIFFVVLLLLLVAASVLAWRMVKRQKRVAVISPGHPQRTSPEVLQPPEDDICYTNLTLQQTGTFPSSPQKKTSTKSCPSAHQAEVEYATMASFPKEDISYAVLSLDTSEQEPTYSNMDDFITHLPSKRHEELTEYSSIKKP